MEPKIGDKMKVSPQLTAQPDWIDGEVIDVELNIIRLWGSSFQLKISSEEYSSDRVVSS